MNAKQRLGGGDDAADHIGDCRGQIVYRAEDAVLDALDDVQADPAPLGTAAIPDTDELGDAGKGSFGQIFGSAHHGIHQRGHQ